jgi:hypothetical protein
VSTYRIPEINEEKLKSISDKFIQNNKKILSDDGSPEKRPSPWKSNEELSETKKVAKKFKNFKKFLISTSKCSAVM